MGRNKGYDRDTVLECAMRLFWKNGYEGTHLGDLVKHTGLNRFGLYKEFNGKEGLFEAALQRYLTQADAAYRTVLEAKPQGLGNIERYFLQIRIEPEYHGCFMINTLTERAVVSETSFAMAKRFSTEVEMMFLANLEAARAGGDISETSDVGTLARLLLTLDQGLSVLGITQPDKHAIDQITQMTLDRIFEKETPAPTK